MSDTLVPISGPPTRGRSCGSCSACCVQVPVDLPVIGLKKANQRCPALRSSGCGVYATRPEACRAWSCRWLFDPDTAELARPDKSGVVIDAAVDQVILNGQKGHAFQLWVDPKRRDAHRDPALRRYLALLAERYFIPILVRWSSTEGLTLIPPSLNKEGEWFEIPGQLHTAEEMKARLAALDDPP